MAPGRLERWLWKGSYELPTEPLAIADLPPPPPAAPDWVGQVGVQLAELWSLIERAREVERRGRERLTPAPAGGAAELKEVARAMLPVLDAFERILEYGRQVHDPNEEFANWLKSVEGVAARMGRVLEKIGLTPVATIGAEVDLALHDVVATVPATGYPEGTIVEERLKGYYFQGKLLRDAKVVVAVSG